MTDSFVCMARTMVVAINLVYPILAILVRSLLVPVVMFFALRMPVVMLFALSSAMKGRLRNRPGVGSVGGRRVR